MAARMTVGMTASLATGALLLLAGCAPIAMQSDATPPPPAPVTAEPIQEPSPEPIEEPSPEPIEESPKPIAQLELNVQNFVAEERGIDADAVTIVSAEAVDWNDGCLGAGQANESCNLVITPGYRVVVSVDGSESTYHTNSDGSHIRPAPDYLPVEEPRGRDSEGEGSELDPQAETIAMTIRQAIVKQLQVEDDAVSIAAVEATEWPDACLGVPNPAEMCAQMITPGYRVVVEVLLGDTVAEYVYHTDATGNSIRLASAPQAQIGDPVVLWNHSEDGCREATIGRLGVAFGDCYGVQMQGYLAGESRQDQLDEFTATYAAFAAETPAGYVEFRGTGSQSATPTEQRMIGEWARLAAQEAAAGPSESTYGLVFAWQREGGSNGQCDSLTVDVTGAVHAAACEDAEPVTIGERRMNALELEQVYAWIDEYAPFEMETADSTTADGATIRLVFSGGGMTEAGVDVQQEIADVAAAHYALNSNSIR